MMRIILVTQKFYDNLKNDLENQWAIIYMFGFEIISTANRIFFWGGDLKIAQKTAKTVWDASQFLHIFVRILSIVVSGFLAGGF